MSSLEDLRSAARTLRRHPALTGTVVGALALGLAAATALFALLDAALFRPLPGRDPERLVRLLAAPAPGEFAPPFSYPMLAHFRERSRALSGISPFSLDHSIDLAVDGRALGRVRGAVVGGDLFALLGVEPRLGRLLDPSDDREGAAVAVLSHAMWQASFGGDPAVVGRRVELNRHPFVVVGVAPPELVGPSYDAVTDLWLPLSTVTQISSRMAALDPLRNEGWYWLGAVGRLAPGATTEAASLELRALTAAWNAARPPDDAYPPVAAAPAGAARFHPDELPRLRRVGASLAAAVALLLSLACAVAATLLLVHGARRQRELAVRMAIGARRGRVARELLAEALLLALLALALALPLAVALHRGLGALMPPDFPLATVAGLPLLSSRVLLFGALAALLTVLAFGLLPALRAARSQPSPALRGAGRGTVSGAIPGLTVLVLQFALTVAVLASAGLLLRTLQRMGGVAPGFPLEGAVVATFDLSTQDYEKERGLALYAAIEEGLRALPGVSAAGLARAVPVRAGGMLSSVAPEGYQPAPDETPRVELNVVGPGFFAALGVPVRGRAFTAADTESAPAVAIVNRAFAARYWPGREALGKRIDGLGRGAAAEVVGVVADYQTQSLREEQGPVLFLPIAQSYVPGATLVVRGTGGAEGLLPGVRQTMARLDPALPLYDTGTLADRLRDSLAQERALAVVLTALGATALLLALLGLGSSLAYATETRTREMGLRLALGARGRQVAWLVVRQALAIAAGGGALGVGLAAWVSRTLEGLLYGVEPGDPSTLLAVVALLLAASVLAAWLPARRAARLDPAGMLREG